MIAIQHSALLEHSAERVFDLVNDIEAYPDFMDGCAGAEIIEKRSNFMVARLDLSKAGLQHSLTTRNVASRPEQIRMELLEGPFASFSGMWRFRKMGESACKVCLDLQFVVSNRFAARAAGRLLQHVGDNLVDAIIVRANSHYDH